MICCNRAMHKRGFSSTGKQRYCCPVCGRFVSEGALPRGGQKGNNPPLTSAEKSRRHRERKKAEKNGYVAAFKELSDLIDGKIDESALEEVRRCK